jgi:hypothetical protein
LNARSKALPGLLDEARRLLERAEEAGLLVRAFGGVAVALLCASATEPPLARSYKDLDLVGLRTQRKLMHEFLLEAGYLPNEEFNALNGRDRLLYWDSVNHRPLDIVLNRFTMCHQIDLTERLAGHALTLDPTDLLLTKLQVVELGENDAKDIICLLLDCEIEDARIAGILAADWGWWRTATQNLTRVRDYALTLRDFASADTVAQKTRQIAAKTDEVPKGYRWRVRSRVGDRVRWYEIPEEEAES